MRGHRCVDNIDCSTKGVHKVLDVMVIAGDNGITASDCAHNDGGVDQIGCPGESAAASSSAVNSPWSVSHSLAASRTAPIDNPFPAAWLSHADTLTPARLAAWATRAATVSSRATESFFTGMWETEIPHSCFRNARVLRVSTRVCCALG